MNNASAYLLLGTSIFAVQVSAEDTSPWKRWGDAIAHQCPANHLEWIYGDGYLELPEAFEATLPKSEKARIKSVADLPHRCAFEHMGFACEFAASVEAYAKLGLFLRFVSYGCSHVRCEEAALCSKFPHTTP